MDLVLCLCLAGSLYEGTVTATVASDSTGPLGVYSEGDRMVWRLRAVTGRNNAVNVGRMTLKVNDQPESSIWVARPLHGQLSPEDRRLNLCGDYAKARAVRVQACTMDNGSTIVWESQNSRVIANVDQRNIAVYWPGDSNKDGRFDSSDLVGVFQIGKYEDHNDDVKHWTDGDWNGDGSFDSADLVIAFQDGRYEMPTAASVSVPEPSGIVTLLISIPCLWLRNRERDHA